MYICFLIALKKIHASLTMSKRAMPKLMAIAATVRMFRILLFSWTQQQNCWRMPGECLNSSARTTTSNNRYPSKNRQNCNAVQWNDLQIRQWGMEVKFNISKLYVNVTKYNLFQVLNISWVDSLPGYRDEGLDTHEEKKHDEGAY